MRGARFLRSIRDRMPACHCDSALGEFAAFLVAVFAVPFLPALPLLPVPADFCAACALDFAAGFGVDFVGFFCALTGGFGFAFGFGCGDVSMLGLSSAGWGSAIFGMTGMAGVAISGRVAGVFSGAASLGASGAGIATSVMVSGGAFHAATRSPMFCGVACSEINVLPASPLAGGMPTGAAENNATCPATAIEVKKKGSKNRIMAPP